MMIYEEKEKWIKIEKNIKTIESEDLKKNSKDVKNVNNDKIIKQWFIGDFSVNCKY